MLLFAQVPPIEKMDATLSTLKACKHLSLSTNNIEKISSLSGMDNLTAGTALQTHSLPFFSSTFSAQLEVMRDAGCVGLPAKALAHYTSYLFPA